MKVRGNYVQHAGVNIPVVRNPIAARTSPDVLWLVTYGTTLRLVFAPRQYVPRAVGAWERDVTDGVVRIREATDDDLDRLAAIVGEHAEAKAAWKGTRPRRRAA